MPVAPLEAVRRQVEREHFVVERAEIGGAGVKRHRRARVGANRGFKDHLPVRGAHGPEHLVAAGEVRDAVEHGGRPVNVVVGLHFPAQRAVGQPQPVERAVVRPDEHDVADDDRRRLHLASGLERPGGLAIGGVDGVHDAAQVADQHLAAGHRRRGLAEAKFDLVLPAHLALVEPQRDQLARGDGHEHRAVGNGRRRLDGVTGLVGPLHLQRQRHLRGADAGERGGAAKLRPGRRRRLRRQSAARGKDSEGEQNRTRFHSSVH